MKIRALIVDQDSATRQSLRRQLECDPEVEVVGECADGLDAVVAIETRRPHLVFLDVRLSGLDGFGVLDAVESRLHSSAEFVLLSSRGENAVRAFDVHAFDYILKPLLPERVRKAIVRFKAIRAKRKGDQLERRIALLLESLRARRSYAEWLLVREVPDEKSVFLKVADISWIEASKGRVILHAGRTARSFRDSLQDVASRLDPSRFLRIHRSTIVNIERIAEVRPWFNGEQTIVLKDGTELTASATFAKELREFRRLGTRRSGRTPGEAAPEPEGEAAPPDGRVPHEAAPGDGKALRP